MAGPVGTWQGFQHFWPLSRRSFLTPPQPLFRSKAEMPVSNCLTPPLDPCLSTHCMTARGAVASGGSKLDHSSVHSQYNLPQTAHTQTHIHIGLWAIWDTWFACLFKLGAAAVFRYVLASFLVARGMVFTRCPKMVLFDFLCTLPKGVGVKIRSPTLEQIYVFWKRK